MNLTNIIVYLNISDGDDYDDYYYYEEGDKYISFIVDLDNYNIKSKVSKPDSIANVKHIQSLDKVFNENL